MKRVSENVISWKRKIRKILQKTEVRRVKMEGDIQIFPLVLLSISAKQRDESSISVMSMTEFVTGAHTSLDSRESRLERNPLSVMSVGPCDRHLS